MLTAAVMWEKDIIPWQTVSCEQLRPWYDLSPTCRWHRQARHPRRAFHLWPPDCCQKSGRCRDRDSTELRLRCWYRSSSVSLSVDWRCLTSPSYPWIPSDTAVNLQPDYTWHDIWASECPDVKNYKWRLNPVWHGMLYSCTHMATVGVKRLTDRDIIWQRLWVTDSTHIQLTWCLPMATAATCSRRWGSPECRPCPAVHIRSRSSPTDHWPPLTTGQSGLSVTATRCPLRLQHSLQHNCLYLRLWIAVECRPSIICK